MPELPEVETVKNILSPQIKGKKIKKIRILRKQTLIGDANEFTSSLEGETFLEVTRIGKFLIFHLTHDKVIVSHLRMEGKYYFYRLEESDSKYSRVVFEFFDNTKLCYDDSRCFGIMILSDELHYKELKEIAKLGPEPFEIKDVSPLLKASKNKIIPIKSALLDQTLITGLGNIYVDETLFASGIHPLTQTNKISKKEWEKIIHNSQNILSEAIKQGGSTIKSYHPGKDIDGMFQESLLVYGKSDSPCPKCQATLRYIKVGGRGTTFCPCCQHKMGEPILVGITGKIASGKSTVLEAFKNKGYDVISCDEIVKNLYKKPEIAKKIEEFLNISFPTNEVNKDILRNRVSHDLKAKKKLEKYIHPLVKIEVINFFKKSKSPLKVVEVPLLFEAGFDDLFDEIIIVEVKENKQHNLLKNRDKEKALDLANINSSNKIDINRGKASFIILNNGDINELNKKSEEVINTLQSRLN